MYRCFWALLYRNVAVESNVFIQYQRNAYDEHWKSVAHVFFYFTGPQSDNFIIGLTNVSAFTVPGYYTVCGQYPGAVPAGATVSLRCNDTDLPPARYVIVQLNTASQLGFCDLNVCAKGDDIRCIVNVYVGIKYVNVFCFVQGKTTQSLKNDLDFDRIKTREVIMTFLFRSLC